MVHIQLPNDPVRPVNNEREANCAANIHIFQATGHVTSAVLNKQRIDDYYCQPEFRRSKLQIANLQFLGRSERQKGTDFKPDEDRQGEQYLVARSFRKNERITDYDRTQKQVVEQMIHVITPPGQTRVPILAQLSVVIVIILL